MPKISKPTTLNKIWAQSGAVVVPSDAKINQGWAVEPPGHQTENYINNRHDLAIAHFNQNGWGEWDANTEYQGNFSWTLGSNGMVYRCKVTNTNQNPVTDLSETYWRKVLDGNLVITSPEVSPYMKTLLDDPNANTAKTTLGFSSLGISIGEAGTAAAARQLLGAGTNGDQLFTSPSAANSRSVIGVVPASDTQEGLVQRATDPETVSGVNDTKFITPKKLKLGFSVSLGTNGFIKFPSWMGGLILQWGITGVVATANQPYTWVYPTPFPNQAFQVFSQYANDGAPSTKAMINVYTVGQSSCLYNYSVTGTHSARFFAIGY